MKAMKWIGIVLFIFIAANAVRYVVNKAKDKMVSPDGKYDVVDQMVGRVAVDQYVEIENKKDTFNLPALKTGIMMFETQNGRFPRDMAELDQSGMVNPEATRDRYGNVYDMKILNDRIVVLQAAGKDKIKGTTDDVEYQLKF